MRSRWCALRSPGLSGPLAYREPEPDEVRPSGLAAYGPSGYVNWVPSCSRCAKTLDLVWMESPSPGECEGCGVRLVP